MRIGVIAFIIFVGISLGFWQEKIKVNINYTLEAGSKLPGFYDQTPQTKREWISSVAIDAPFDYYHNHQKIDWLLTLTEQQLTQLKWLVTLFFILTYLTINLLILKLMTNSKMVIRGFAILYGVFVTLALSIYIMGKLTGTLKYAYGISREIAGGLQSMVPLLIALPAWWLWKNYPTQKDEKTN